MYYFDFKDDNEIVIRDEKFKIIDRIYKSWIPMWCELFKDDKNYKNMQDLYQRIVDGQICGTIDNWSTNLTATQAKLSDNYGEKKGILFVNENCHSASLLGHQFLLKLDEYKIIKKTSKDDLPMLKIGNEIFTGINLQRKIMENIGIKDLTESQLQGMLGNDHRNCMHD